MADRWLLIRISHSHIEPTKPALVKRLPERPRVYGHGVQGLCSHEPPSLEWFWGTVTSCRYKAYREFYLACCQSRRTCMLLCSLHDYLSTPEVG